MKEIKYILGIGVVLSIVDVAALGVLKVVNSTTGEAFYRQVAESLSVIGIIVLAALIIALIVRAFASK